MEDWLRSFIEKRRVGRLATVDDEHHPHVVPIVYAFDGKRLYTPIDAKPKRVEAGALQRVRNIRANPRAAVIVDRYSEDWERLAWVQLRGRARYVQAGEERDRGVRLLEQKYSQYDEMPLAGRPIIILEVDKVVSWRASQAG
ncbi:MAG: TIGR03668 family PPOX class F420-dependent oxidoreductase [Candidatus Promineifilaceae bacterium]|nr:TIGR03668 family PPOX class F420-dependent oxidoreductase [Candidatus Promineifilaceae bacterium]